MLQEQMNSTNNQNVTLDLLAKYIQSHDFQQGFKAWRNIEQSYGHMHEKPIKPITNNVLDGDAEPVKKKKPVPTAKPVTANPVTNKKKKSSSDIL